MSGLTFSSAQATPVTVSYQFGVNGYGSTQDLAFNNQTGPSGASYQSYKLLVNNGTGTYECRALLRFGNLNLPVGAVVSSSTLTLSYYRATAGARLRLYYVQNGWDYTVPTSINWVSRSGSSKWTVPGASGDSTDRLAGGYIYPVPTSTGEATTVTQVNLYQTQCWQAYPTRNWGVLIVNETPDKPVWLYSSLQSKSSQRPKLTLTYDVDTTPPAVSITSPTSGGQVAGYAKASASVSSSKYIGGVQFYVDGAPYGAEDPAAPYEVTMDTKALGNGTHTVSAKARDLTGVTATTPATSFVVANDLVAPTAAITSPAAGSLLTGVTRVTASAYDAVGVVGVQFKLDGANLGAVQTTAPYGVDLDPTGLAEGPHSLSAQAWDAAGNRGTSPVSLVTVPTARQTRSYYVSNAGNDAWSGSLPDPNSTGTDGPFATLERARTAIRDLKTQAIYPPGGVTVYLRGGTYYRSTCFELSTEDSGNDAGPTVFSAYNNEFVRITGGQEVTGWTSVSDPAVLSRLKSGVAANVVQVNLKALGITDYGSLIRRGDWGATQTGGLELTFQDAPMTLARYPNTGFLHTTGAPLGRFGGQFNYEGDEPAGWASSSDIWVSGYWYSGWAQTYEKVAQIDPGTRTVTTVSPSSPSGYRAWADGVPGAQFYFQNVLEELDSPGEYYLDRGTGTLYFWPPAPISTGKTVVTMASTRLIGVASASNITLRGLTLENGRDHAILVGGCTNVRLESCNIRNMGRIGAYILQSKNSGLDHCTIHDTGSDAVRLDAGDRPTLTPGGCFVTNSSMYDYARWDRTHVPAARCFGVGNRVAHNTIYSAPAQAVHLMGNDHTVEYNEISNVCYEARDVGAIYLGRDWTARGNLIRYNYIHDLPMDSFGMVQAVYLDDLASGTTVYGNLFQRAARGVLVGGGRDNLIDNNVFAECYPDIQIDERGMRPSFSATFIGPSPTDTTLYDYLTQTNATSPTSPYAKYPHMTDLLNDEPARCKYNAFSHNIHYKGKLFLELAADNLGVPINGASGGSPITLATPWWNVIQTGRKLSVTGVGGLASANGIWNVTKVDELHFSLDGSAGSGTYTGGGYACSYYLTIQNNLDQADPQFVDYAGGNFQLMATSPALALGFTQLPQAQIGPQP